MEGVDKEKVKRVIYEMSKGSKFFENEQKKEAITKLKVEHLRAQCAKLTDNDISHFQKVRDLCMCRVSLIRSCFSLFMLICLCTDMIPGR